jgi:hypothetical protein
MTTIEQSMTNCTQCQTPNSCGGDGRCLEAYIKERLVLHRSEIIAELTQGAEMPEPLMLMLPNKPETAVYSYTQCQDYAAAAVAKVKNEHDAHNNSLTQVWRDDGERIKQLTAERDALRSALQAIVTSLAEHDDEGMIEHAQQMIDARAALEATK